MSQFFFCHDSNSTFLWMLLDPVVRMLTFTAVRSKGAVMLTLHARKPFDNYIEGVTKLLLVALDGHRFTDPIDITGRNTGWEIRQGSHCSWALSNNEHFAHPDSVEGFVVRVEHQRYPVICGVMLPKEDDTKSYQ